MTSILGCGTFAIAAATSEIFLPDMHFFDMDTSFQNDTVDSDILVLISGLGNPLVKISDS